MAILIKVAAVAVAGTVLGLVIKKNSPEMALMLTISLALIALYLAFDTIKSVTDFITSMASAAQISPAVLTVVLKAVGISIVTKLSADVCRDAGQSSVASGIELTGAFAALYIALPLFKTVMDMLESLV
ncbi:stage III sporulation protein AD [Sporobacter termitidis DSM 10068]|uniref:Stage III sporulation protein AD n=1 Tax=Sporobacter termitidis DSM 10068 TaxID=1123282 RepID=A0A1M5Y881_9FIRM|nr:stage III sporulation AC/AD family protein [Sporobacter termitidis]SHI08300.1 stage III sporulation protein AD [Sporobacter termitidis DSM 10068]